MGRTLLAIFCSLIALAAFGFALSSTGAHLISDCSESVMGPASYVWVGIAIFFAAGITAIRLRHWTAYLLVTGLAPLLLLHDFIQQEALRDIIDINCPSLRLR